MRDASRHTIAAACALLISVVAVEAEALGPYLEVHQGVAAPTFVETGNGTDLGPGPSFGGALGVHLSGPLALELWTQAISYGGVSSDSEDLELSWSQSAFALAARVEPVVLTPRLRLSATAGFGLTFLDLEVKGREVADQSSSAFTGLLGLSATVDVAWGVYLGLDLRYLLTPTWKDTSAGNQELESFSNWPLLATVTVGYQLDVF